MDNNDYFMFILGLVVGAFIVTLVLIGGTTGNAFIMKSVSDSTLLEIGDRYYKVIEVTNITVGKEGKLYEGNSK